MCGDGVVEVGCAVMVDGGVNRFCGGVLNSWRRVRGGACEEQVVGQFGVHVGSQKRICSF